MRHLRHKITVWETFDSFFSNLHLRGYISSIIYDRTEKTLKINRFPNIYHNFGFGFSMHYLNAKKILKYLHIGAETFLQSYLNFHPRLVSRNFFENILLFNMKVFQKNQVVKKSLRLW